jgi:hypothetical protein
VVRISSNQVTHYEDVVLQQTPLLHLHSGVHVVYSSTCTLQHFEPESMLRNVNAGVITAYCSTVSYVASRCSQHKSIDKSST